MADSILLIGYQGAVPLYRVLWHQGNLLGQTAQGVGWVDGDVPGVIARVDRICCWERDSVAEPPAQGQRQAEPFWMLEVVPGVGNTLTVTAPTMANAEVAASLQIRVWLEKGRLSSTLSFIVPADQSVPHFSHFEISSSGKWDGWAGFSGSGLRGVKAEITKTQQSLQLGYFDMPAVGGAMGLKAYGTVLDPHTLAYGWGFVPSDASPQVLLTFNLQVLAKQGSPVLLGFGFPLTWEALHALQTDGTANDDYVKLFNFEQAQPTGYTLDTFLVQTFFRWRIAVLVPNTDAVDLFNSTVTTPVLDALEVVRGGATLSFLPLLGELDWSYWQAQYVLEDRGAPNDNSGPVLATVADVPQAARLLYPKELVPQNQTVQVTLPGLRTTAGSPANLMARLVAAGSDQSYDLGEGYLSGWQFALQLQHRAPVATALPATAQVAKMGALDVLLFAPAAKPNDAGADLGSIWAEVFEGTEIRARMMETGPQTWRALSRDVQYTLAVVDVAPGGQDAIPADTYVRDPDTSDTKDGYLAKFKRAEPLVLQPKLPGLHGNAAFYLLRISEKIAPGVNQTILATLRLAPENSDIKPSALDSYVLDAEPFLAAKVSAQSFWQQYRAALTNVVGLWSNAPGVDGWQFSAGATSFTLGLPPQTMGEAMHKRSDSGDVVQGKPIDYRFPPAAELELRAAYFQQRFAEAPWNLRRVLGYVGQRAPGAELLSARLELLYGLAVTIGKPNARLAEIGARLGAYAGSQNTTPSWPMGGSQGDLFKLQRNLWAAMQPLLRSRLAALEPWRDLSPGSVSFDAENEVSIVQRGPKGSNGTVGALLAPPLPLQAGSLQSGYFTAGGLPGGWSWGFESSNILEAVLRDPASTYAELHGLLLSSLGAWGHQKASFDRGLTTIYCQVSMGRVESINIERIGRIEPFWNRAKHVIVYRRTVAASRQFYLEQLPLTGIPLLRKTEEYVELIENERAFPDANTPVAERGFVLGSRFDGKPARIAVDSQWGGDVGTFGWQVPLWRRTAAPADVYPRPEIGLLFAGRQDGETLKHAILNPELVRFYTNTDVKAGAVSDDWPAVEGISYTKVDPAVFGLLPDTPFEQMKQPLTVLPGTGDFTFLLDGGPAASNVVAERTANPIVARVTSVTVMRGYVQGLPADPPSWTTVKTARETVTNALAPALARLSSIATLPADGIAPQPDSIGDVLKATLPALGTQGTPNGPGQPDTPGVATVLTGLLSNPVAQTVSLADSVGSRLLSRFDLFAVPMRSDLLGEVLGFGAKVVSAVKAIRDDQEWMTAAELPVDAIALDGARGLIAQTVDLLWNGADGFLDSLSRVRGLPLDTRAAVAQAIDQVQTAADQAEDAIDQARIAWAMLATGQTPAAFRQRMTDLGAAVEEQLARMEYLAGQPLQAWVGTQTNAVQMALANDDANKRAGTRSLRLRLLKLRTGQGVVAPQTEDESLAALESDIQDLASRAAELMTMQWLGPLNADSDDPNSWNPSSVLDPLDEFWDLIAGAVCSETGIIYRAATWDDLLTKIVAYFEDLFRHFEEMLDELLKKLRDAIAAYAKQLGGVLGKVLPELAELGKDIGALLQGLAADWQGPLANAGLSSLEVRRELELIEKLIGGAVDALVERLRLYHLPAVSVPGVSADSVLRLLRAFGDPPRVPGLSFELPNIAFPSSAFHFFDFSLPLPALLKQIDLSPIRSIADGLASLPKLLNPLRIVMPAVGLLDRLLPPDLTSLDLTSVFSHWGGMQLADLFPGLKMPVIAQQNIRLTHGEDISARSAWMQADVDVPFNDQPVDVFSLAGIHLRLLQARFRGKARVEATAGQTPKQTTLGSITGEWEISIGGFPIANMVDCSLRYDEGGHLNFDVSLDRIRLQSVLEFISDLLSGIGGDSGFTFTVDEQGALATLNLPLPDISAGTFGITNLSLGFYFGVSFRGAFTLSTGLNVARRTAPFTLTVFILGGAGYFESEISYQPSKHEFATRVSVGMFASASLAISLGPIHGGVYAYFGITAEFLASHEHASSLDISILILFRGEVNLLGFISVSLMLSLEAGYSTGGNLLGRGAVEFHIKIGWFIDINVRASVEYRFGSNSNGSGPKPAIAAANHEAMFA